LVVQLLNHATTRTYLVLVFVVLFATDAADLLFYFSFWPVLLIWVVILISFVLAFFSLVLLLAWLEQRKISIRPYRATLFLASTLPAIALGEGLSFLLSAGNNPFEILPRGAFFMLLAEIFGTIYFTMLLPQLLRDLPPFPQEQPKDPLPAEPEVVPEQDLPAPTLDEPPAQERFILIGAEPIALSRLRVIEAREHHVHVSLEDESLMLRARMSDILAQTQAGDGVQTHRSWWVSAQAAQALGRDGNKHVLHISDGRQIPVARTRLGDVKHWMQSQRDSDALEDS
jgi:hypothetical protein